MLPVKFSNIVFPVLNFVGSLKFYYETISVSRCHWNHLKSDFSTANWRAECEEIRQVYSTEFLLNTAMIREVNSTEINSNFSARETQDFLPLQHHGYKQSSKLSQLQNTQLNLLTVIFLAILKWTAINLRWLFVNGRVKQAKDWLLPLTFRSEI